MRRPIREPGWCIGRKMRYAGRVEPQSLAGAPVKSISQWMTDRGLAAADLVAASQLDQRVVEAIVQGRYTPSPDQRQRLAVALSVAPDQIAWGHTTPVEHMYGHGAQFGRSP
jgi:ribosome-binding protein aMBF1 (putative translation factor)